MELVLTKYKTLYSGVLTNNSELQHLNCIVDNDISDFKQQGVFFTPDLTKVFFKAKLMGMLVLNQNI